MGRSIIVDVRKAVVAGLTEALSDESVSCSYGWLGGSEDRRREQIYTNKPRATHSPAALTSDRLKRREDMDFDVCLWVSDPGKPPEDIDDRLMEIGEVIEEFFADRKSNELEVAGLNWIHITGFELENRLMERGAASLGVWTVTYNARLT